MRALCSIALIALTVSLAHAAPTVEAVRLTAPVQLDGQLTEAVWQTPAPLDNFALLNSGAAPKAPTQAWVAYDDDALYVAVKAVEPDMGQLRATVKDRDSSKLFGDDVLEVFVDPARDRFHYLQFATNALGTPFDVQGDSAGASPPWNGVWEVAAFRGEGFWSAEFRLPFATLGVSRLTGKVWGLNVCRERPGGGENSSWAPTAGKFANPPTFGEMQLSADLSPFKLDVAVKDWGAGLIGHNGVKARVDNLARTAQNLKLTLAATDAEGKSESTGSMALPVPAGVNAEAALSYQLTREGSHFLSLTAADVKTGRLLAATGWTVTASALADFSILKSFYRDDVTVRYALNVSPQDLQRYRIALQLRSADGTKTLAAKSLDKITSGRGDIAFDTAQLPRGRYSITAVLRDATGQTLLDRTLQFAELRDLSVKARVVTVRPEDNMLIVEGKPFFTLGIYEGAATLKYLQSLREAGFNLCLSNGLSPEGARKVLDAVHSTGMHLWVPVSATLDFSKDADHKRADLTRLVQAVGDDPGLLCWESIDEPAWGDQNADGLYEGYCFLRALDQQRPIWTNHAPRNTVATLAYFNRATDISGCDIYPVPEGVGHSNLPNAGLSVVGDETDKNREALGGHKPVSMVLQGFGWGELSKTKAVMPTFEQSRFMAYDSIVHGATGILYWGTEYTQKPSRFWSELRSLVSELAALQDVLAALPVTGPAQARLVGESQGLKLLHKEWQGKQFVMLVNDSKQPVTAKLQVPGVKQARLKRLFESQVLDRGPGGSWPVALKPYDVAVLSDDLGFRDVRHDYSAEWRNATANPTAQADLTVPGNLLRNPGFEVDANGDGMPDEWGANTSLTSELVTNETHEGRYALAVTSDSPLFAPLLVQRSLPLVGDHKYRFTAWIKSPSPDAEFRFYVEWVLGDKWLGKVLPWTKGSGEWQQFTLDFPATPDPQGGAYAVVQMRGKGTVYFDELRIQEVP